uniref:Uncharacterized protein n=1 Tax=Hyaloperonospora arabidopsidis (strain Emoy2) TaxID=559515 RepID=M4BAD7_HYAAE
MPASTMRIATLAVNTTTRQFSCRTQPLCSCLVRRLLAWGRWWIMPSDFHQARARFWERAVAFNKVSMRYNKFQERALASWMSTETSMDVPLLLVVNHSAKWSLRGSHFRCPRSQFCCYRRTCMR